LRVNAQTQYLDKQKLSLGAKRYAPPSRWTSTKQVDTHADRFSQKTNLSSDTKNAQILCVSIFKVCFSCRPLILRTSSMTKKILVPMRGRTCKFFSARQFSFLQHFVSTYVYADTHKII
jgi:hypothetical protein